jgi:hypothetical protein
MNTFKELIKYPYAKWCMVMFPYGVYRQWNCHLEPPYDLLGHRIIGSSMNGLYYISPLGVTKIFDLFNRIDIKYHNLEKKNYKDSYKELLGYNDRMF